MTAPFWVEPGAEEALWLLGGRYSWKALGVQTGGDYSLCEVLGPRGFAIPVHSHDRENEGFFVASGKVTLLLGEEQVSLGEGAFGFAPAGVHHSFRLDSDEARLLLLVTPGAAGHESMFAAMGEPADGPGLPPAPTEPPDFDALAVIAAANGTRIVGPPLGT